MVVEPVVVGEKQPGRFIEIGLLIAEECEYREWLGLRLRRRLHGGSRATVVIAGRERWVGQSRRDKQRAAGQTESGGRARDSVSRPRLHSPAPLHPERL